MLVHIVNIIEHPGEARASPFIFTGKEGIVLAFSKQAADTCRLQRLIELHGSVVLAAARRILGPGPDAEEVAQETFVTAFTHLSRLGEDAGPSTRRFLVLIAENKAIDLYRARARHPQLPLEDETLRVFQPEPSAGELGDCLLALPPRDRALLLLKYHWGYTVREAAQLLGLSTAAAYKAEQRAKARLETLCKERGLLE